jgi:saccharopine dehydrogenase (NADP+, L-glutamate forming)
MGEMGWDPGLEQMSSKKMIDELKDQGAEINSFRSFTGSLLAPESDDNPWNYKFTWSPRNVVLAGQGTAQYLLDGKVKFIPYHRLFAEYETLDVPGMGEMEAFLNRDALLYKEVYGLENVPNILKGTIRRRGFCDAWNALVKLGVTDGDFPILDADSMTYHAFMEAFIPPGLSSGSVKERVAQLIGETPGSPIMKKLEWLGLFRKKKVNLAYATPALILENLLLKKWKLKTGDRDLVLIFHDIEYTLKGQTRRRTATVLQRGEYGRQTAMANAVGLPMGIFLRLFMEGKITSKGMHVPVTPEVYGPVLSEMEQYELEISIQDFD